MLAWVQWLGSAPLASSCTGIIIPTLWCKWHRAAAAPVACCAALTASSACRAAAAVAFRQRVAPMTNCNTWMNLSGARDMGSQRRSSDPKQRAHHLKGRPGTVDRSQVLPRRSLRSVLALKLSQGLSQHSGSFPSAPLPFTHVGPFIRTPSLSTRIPSLSKCHLAVHAPSRCVPSLTTRNLLALNLRRTVRSLQPTGSVPPRRPLETAVHSGQSLLAVRSGTVFSA